MIRALSVIAVFHFQYCIQQNSVSCPFNNLRKQAPHVVLETKQLSCELL